MASGAETVTISHPDGPLEVPADAVLRLTEPLLGFPERLEFVLLPTVRRGVWWFISVGEPTVTFVLADPFVAMPDYQIDVGDADIGKLRPQSSEALLSLVMLTLPLDPSEAVVASFRAPLVFNILTGVGTQVVNGDDRYPLKGHVNLSLYPMEKQAILDA